MKLRSRVGQLRYFYLLTMGVFFLVALSSVYFIFIRGDNNSDSPNTKKTSLLKNEAPGPPAGPSQLETSGSKIATKLLSSKDYSGYQAYQRSLANEYLGKKDYNNANRIMGLVRSNVPTDSIQANSYSLMIEIAKGSKDTAKTKEYLTLAIAAFNKEGQAEIAAGYTKDLEAIN